MAIDNFIPEVWSARLLLNFRKSFKFNMLVNRNYEGEISDSGDTVRITTPSAITVSDYAGTVTYQTPTSSQQTLLIDQDKYWAFEVDDLEKVQANVSLIDVFTEEAGVALADNVDQNIAALYTDVGDTVNLDISTGTGSFANVRPALIDLGQKLDEANVPQEGRWLMVSPTVMAGVRKASDYTPASEMGDEMKRTGAIGFLEGFNIHMSNNVAVATQHKCLAGTNAAITFAEQLVMTEALRRDTSFKDAVRGRLVFGRKVVRPAALLLLNTTV